ncbi:unnamed protein product [Prunus armeniaca]
MKASSAVRMLINITQIFLVWDRPDTSQFKLNVEGSSKCASRVTGAGRVICDDIGNWIGSFVANLGSGDILAVEIWGLFFGLKLAIQRDISNLCIEMDSVTAVLLFQKSSLFVLHLMASLLSSCYALMRQVGNCVINHIYREKNRAADCLAKGSYNFDLGVCGA